MKIKNFFFNVLLVLFSFIATLIILEIFCRAFIKFDSGFYSLAKRDLNKPYIVHPYGKIPINKQGFFDKDFEFKNDKPIIGYFGDSVTYGVGAGYPYRFTEYLDDINPKFEHINLSGGLGASLINWNTRKEKFLLSNNVKRIVYVMNMNDIAPLSNQIIEKNNEKKGIKNINYIKNFVRPFDQILRGNSNLYTYLRFLIKKRLVKAGYDSSGYEAIELFPKKNINHIVNSAKQIDKWLEKTQNLGLTSCVVVLPYEMQISKDAENHYRSINIKFDKDFINFSTQKLIKKNLKNFKNFYIVTNKGFEEKKIGHYFVYNKGDKIDFNHPNRKGHLVIAREINNKKICQN